ncbi:MucBP domain-containing protein [Lactococcus lactis]|uniref:MucBP domain-containing protein n=1 Tax=Lactococcus lactis TaxID=1358 RepID=UPI0026594D88|nr:MucBP domain-containing protein [Lactococcus lactis]WKF72447.1 MucBP domain-containing protein [Lactococcus lactis]
MLKKTISFLSLGIILSSSSLPVLAATTNSSSAKNINTASSSTAPTESTQKSTTKSSLEKESSLPSTSQKSTISSTEKGNSTNIYQVKSLTTTESIPANTRSKQAATDSGTFGSSQWTIDNSGTLTINSGVFDNVTDGKSPWNSYKDQIKTIVFTGQVLAAPDSSMLFGDMSSLTNIEGSENLNTSNVTNMQAMFYNCSSLVSIDVSNWDTANVTIFSAMFASCSSLSSLDVSNWNTTKGTKMTATFLGCGSLSSLDLSNWNTINVTDMAGMFSFCSALKKLRLGYNFSFQNNSSLPDLKVDDKYTGKWQNIGNGTDEKPIGVNIWTSDQLMTNYKGAMDADTYVWQPKIPGKNVTVRYVDESGKEIASTVTLTGNVGDSYTSKQEIIKGYTFKEVQGNATGTFSDQAQTITYVYTKDPVPAKDVTVKYVDESGKEIASTVTLTGNVGDSYTSKQEIIKGYTFKEVQGNATGTFSDQAQTITYVYTKDPVPAKDVTVKYVDESGKEIASTVTLTGNVGDSYTSKQEIIKGYTFKEVQGNATGTFSDQAQTITYVYTKDSVPAKDVTVKYVDESGKEIASTVTLTGNVGDTYISKQETIKGYTFKEVQGNVTGTFSDQAQTITYIYKKAASIPDSHNNNPKAKKEIVSKVTNTQDKNQNLLPTTGDNNLMFMIELLVGSILVFLSGAIFLRTKRINKRK